MDSRELLRAIINDMDNRISGYKEVRLSVNDKSLKIVYTARIHELQDWIRIFKDLLNELD